MQILMIGDVVGNKGCEFLRSKLPSLKRLKGIDLVIANGENSADGNGITPSSAEMLFSCGVDIITSGNHVFRRKEMYDMLENEPLVLRPANYPDSAPGNGWCMYDMGRVQVCVINLLGTVYLESLDCPFRTVDRILEKAGNPRITIIDFHAEATAEKRALGFYLDGRVSAVVGTHTHVQTADAQILPNGTGYITDVGMVGCIDSVLGVKPELAIAKMKNKLPTRFENAIGEQMINAVLFSIDDRTGRATSVESLSIK